MKTFIIKLKTPFVISITCNFPGRSRQILEGISIARENRFTIGEGWIVIPEAETPVIMPSEGRTDLKHE